MSQINTNAIFDASGGSTAQINGATPTVYNTMGRNRIINGDMRIDQRNAGAAVIVDGYCLDRWITGYAGTTSGQITVQQSSDTPTGAGFTNSLSLTVTTADASFGTEGYYLDQRIEGFNSADLMWGSASAKPVTISFWIKASVTGDYPLIIQNSADTRIYGVTYTINSANTWEYKTLTIPGDTTGTWLTTNGKGVRVIFGLGGGSSRYADVGWATKTSFSYTSMSGAVNFIATSGATLYLTGVQLEVGSVATEFERRPYGTELALCQRYYQKSFNTETKPTNGSTSTNFATFKGAYLGPVQRPGAGFTYPGTADDGGGVGSFVTGPFCAFSVKMRTTPSMQNYGNSTGNWWICDSGGNYYYVNPFNTTDQTGATGFCPNFASYIGTNTFAMCSGHWTATAEL